MKFSVLLPTRNRLQFLKYAIASVLKQNYDNWEIIISDNNSTENIEEHVKFLNDPRIKYSRTKEFVSITQNWNRCVDQATGEYLIMLGDDDILLKNYFEIALKLINNFQNPELIYTNAYLYAYPEVVPKYQKGIFQSYGSTNAMHPKADSPFWLDKPIRLHIVQQMLRFQSLYGTNMQHALIHHSLVKKILKEGKLFHSPYPDFYTMNAFFLEAERVLVYPKEIVVIGITSKSHGYYFFNNREQEGVDFLNITSEMREVPNIQGLALPGSGLTFWLASNEVLKKFFPFEKYRLHSDYYQIYRRNHINNVLHNFLDNKTKYRHEFSKLMHHLTLSEKVSTVYPTLAKIQFKKMIPNILKKIIKKVLHRLKKTTTVTTATASPLPSVQGLYPIGSSEAHPIEGKYQNIMEIFDQILPIDCA